MSNENDTNQGNGGTAAASLNLTGGAAVIAPVSAFPNGVPSNALIVLPLSKPTDELVGLLEKGPVALQQDQMWKLLGFNGPPVQVQDDQGRPVAIGLEDLLAGLEKHWNEAPDDLNRARIYAQELLKYQRFEKAEGVLGKVVAKGGLVGDDWLALGVAQLQLKKYDKAESTLKGAQNIMKTNPFPSLHLAKVAQEKGDRAAEKATLLRAVEIAPNVIDSWVQLFVRAREADGEEKAIAEIEELALKEPCDKTAAPFIAVQTVYATNEETRDKAMTWAKRAVERAPEDPVALIGLSALYGFEGKLDKVIEILQPHEAKMLRDVRLANNYFEALFQSRQIDKVTRFLNALAGSPVREVKQFAIERSRAVAQYLQQQQQQLAQAAQGAAQGGGPGGGRPAGAGGGARGIAPPRGKA
jgi:tetratricopeptide (TPR) repeat protein